MSRVSRGEVAGAGFRRPRGRQLPQPGLAWLRPALRQGRRDARRLAGSLRHAESRAADDDHRLVRDRQAMTLPRWLPPLLFLLAVAGCRMAGAVAGRPGISCRRPRRRTGQPACFAAAMLPTAAPSAHAATLAELPDGRLAAAWFAGTREGAADVAVWFATLRCRRLERAAGHRHARRHGRGDAGLRAQGRQSGAVRRRRPAAPVVRQRRHRRLGRQRAEPRVSGDGGRTLVAAGPIADFALPQHQHPGARPAAAAGGRRTGLAGLSRVHRQARRMAAPLGRRPDRRQGAHGA